MGLVMRKAVMGGTFDPVHGGHIRVADTVQQFLSPSEIIFMPAGRPWLKKTMPAPVSDRLAMLRLAVEGCPGFSVSTIEAERPGPTYTVDTLRQMRASYPENELFFIIGWDNLPELPRWHQPQELLKLCRLVAVPRIGFTMPEAEQLDEWLPGLAERGTLLSQPLIDISSSVVRERVRLGLSIENLVPEAVALYIREKGMYGACS